MKAFQKAKAGGSSSAGHPSSRFAGGTKFGGSPSKGPLKSDSLKTRLLANEAIAHNKRSSDVAIAVDPGLIEDGESFNEPVEEIDIEVSTKPKSMASRFASPNFGANSSKASIEDSNSKAAAKQSSDVAATIETNLNTSLDTNMPESPANSGKNTPQKRVSFSDEVSGITGVRSVEMPKPRLGSIKDAAKAAAAAALAEEDEDSEREERTMRNVQQAAKASRASLEAAELAREIELEEKMKRAQARRLSLDNANSVMDKERSRRRSMMENFQQASKSDSSIPLANKSGARSRSFNQGLKKPSITEAELKAFSEEVRVRESISGSPRSLTERKSFKQDTPPPPPRDPDVDPAGIEAEISVTEGGDSILIPPPASAMSVSRAVGEEDSASDDTSSDEAFIGTAEPLREIPAQPMPSPASVQTRAAPAVPAASRKTSEFRDELPEKLRSVNMSRLFAAPGAPDLPTSQPPGANEGDTHEFSSSSGPGIDSSGRRSPRSRLVSMPPHPPPPMPPKMSPEISGLGSKNTHSRAGSTGNIASSPSADLNAPFAEDNMRSPSFVKMYGDAPPTLDHQPTPRIPDFRAQSMNKTSNEADVAVRNIAGSRSSYGAVEETVQHASSAPGNIVGGMDINEVGRRNIHETIQQCLESELENTTFAIRGDLQAMSRNMAHGTKLMLGEHNRSVSSLFSEIIDAVDMRIKVAFDCYDEVAREEVDKIEDLSTRVDALGKALNASKREYEYSQEKLISDFSRKVEDERQIFDASTRERQTEIKENFADIQRAVMQMREADRREVYDLVKEAHDTSQRVLMDHHDQVGVMHRDFEKRLARFQIELKEQHDANHAAINNMMEKTVGRAEEMQKSLLRQQREIVEQLTEFMKQQQSARAADKAEILSLAGITKEAANKLHENTQENLVYVQDEVVDLRRKLFLQEQSNYDLKREYSRLLQKQSSHAAGSVEVFPSATSSRLSPTDQVPVASNIDRVSPESFQRPFSPAEDSQDTLAAMSPSVISSNPLKAAVGDSLAYSDNSSSPSARTLPDPHNKWFSHGGSTQLSYDQHGLPDYANLKFGGSARGLGGEGLQEAKESPADVASFLGRRIDHSKARIDKPTSRARTPSPSGSSIRFKNMKAKKEVNGNKGLVSNSPYIMSVSSDETIRLKQMRDQMHPKPGQQY